MLGGAASGDCGLVGARPSLESDIILGSSVSLAGWALPAGWVLLAGRVLLAGWVSLEDWVLALLEEDVLISLWAAVPFTSSFFLLRVLGALLLRVAVGRAWCGDGADSAFRWPRLI